MPSSKALRIMTEIVSRLETAGYTVYRDRREPQAAELPCFNVYGGPRTAEQVQNKRIQVAQSITVVGYRAVENDDTEATGDAIISDIVTAVETGDETLGGLIQGSKYGLQFESDEIFLPEAGESVVAAQVVYAAPHIRIWGDPETI